jgi:Carbohydrate phosphorylase
MHSQTAWRGRRWLAFCNPELSALITKTLGSDEWTLNMKKLRGLEKYAEDPEFQKKWRAVKVEKKAQLASACRCSPVSRPRCLWLPAIAVPLCIAMAGRCVSTRDWARMAVHACLFVADAFC